MNRRDMEARFLLLQINDSLFPIGGYSHSYGLETYIQKGLVSDGNTARLYIENRLRCSLLYTDLLAVRLAYEAAAKEDLEKLEELEDVLDASKIPMELREQTFSVDCSGSFIGDVHWTAEGVGNLIKNAMEHTPAGGSITVRGRENALFSELVVEDTGPGIDPQDLPHLFERFYRGSSRTSHGFGIGLSLTQRIVTGQGGTIQARNRTPQGAQFVLRFYKGTV